MLGPGEEGTAELKGEGAGGEGREGEEELQGVGAGPVLGGSVVLPQYGTWAGYELRLCNPGIGVVVNQKRQLAQYIMTEVRVWNCTEPSLHIYILIPFPVSFKKVE